MRITGGWKAQLPRLATGSSLRPADLLPYWPSSRLTSLCFTTGADGDAAAYLSSGRTVAKVPGWEERNRCRFRFHKGVFLWLPPPGSVCLSVWLDQLKKVPDRLEGKLQEGSKRSQRTIDSILADDLDLRLDPGFCFTWLQLHKGETATTVRYHKMGLSAAKWLKPPWRHSAVSNSLVPAGVAGTRKQQKHDVGPSMFIVKFHQNLFLTDKQTNKKMMTYFLAMRVRCMFDKGPTGTVITPHPWRTL